MGAVFCTYTLDPRFFEEKILTALLDIRSDPQEQVSRYLEEARARLRELPLICIADKSMYRGGHRLPFDLLLFKGRTFHPKLSLILFERQARLMIGSGNLTEQGYGGNSEIFQCVNLIYDNREDRAILDSVDKFFKRIANSMHNPGKQLPEFHKQLKRLCPNISDIQESKDINFLHTETSTPLLEQFLSLIPEPHEITRVGLIAPFYEEDNSQMETSVLVSLKDFADKRKKRKLLFEVGLPWEEPSLGQKGEKNIMVENHLDQLWGQRRGEGNRAQIEYFVPKRVTKRKVFIEDQQGKRRSLYREDFEYSMEKKMTWPVGKVNSYGPNGIINEIAESCPEASFWLFPNIRLEDSEIVHRPLHAKLYLVTSKFRNKCQTYILIGSPNASRRALIFQPPKSNVETAFAIIIEGDYGLIDFAPLIVKCPRDQIVLADRIFPPTETNWANIIIKAIYNAGNEKLQVEWNHDLNNLSFKLLYMDHKLYSGPMPEEKISTWDDFTLSPACCELTITLHNRDFFVPIYVEDIQNLPANPSLRSLGLEELLAYFSGRMSLEAITRSRKNLNKGTSPDTGLSFVFGERFQPVDVFKAWFGMNKDLSDPELTVGGFRVILEGPAGVQQIWNRMIEAANKEKILAEEAWVYGLELYRTLEIIEFGSTPSGKDKNLLLKDWLGKLTRDLKKIKPVVKKHGWINKVESFYGVRK